MRRGSSALLRHNSAGPVLHLRRHQSGNGCSRPGRVLSVLSTVVIIKRLCASRPRLWFCSVAPVRNAQMLCGDNTLHI
jgi:hypothetical protein